MTQICFFDVESNGLPKNRNIDGNVEPNNWPELLSIAWKIYEANINPFNYHYISFNLILKIKII